MKSKAIAVIAMVATIVLPVHGGINPIVTEVTLESGGYLCLNGAAKVVTFTIDSGSADLAWGGVDDEGNGIATDKIEVRDSAGVLVSTPYQVSANGTVSVKGVNVSDALEDVHMTLTGHHSDPVSDVKKTIKFTVIKVESITVRPKETPVDYELPEPVCIGAGAIESEAHQADVTIQVIPQEEGIPISVSLLNGRGHGAAGAAEEDIPHAKLVMGSATATGSKEAVTVETSAGGKIEGVLTSSDVINNCTIHTCTKERLVKFTWDTFEEEGEWTTDLGYLPVPGVLENYLTLRHHRADADDAPWKPLNNHDIKFFVEKVEYLNAEGELQPPVLNTPDNPNTDIRDWAYFPDDPVTTSSDGIATVSLTTVDNEAGQLWRVYMVAYDWTLWKQSSEPPTPLAAATVVLALAEEEEEDDGRNDHVDEKKGDEPVIDVDLDIDSDNNDLLSPPQMSASEEALEDAPDHPGKAVALNELDRDKDGVPDYADGYNIMLPTIFSTTGVDQSGVGKSSRFVPLVLRVPTTVDWSVATVCFTSSADVNLLSNPSAVTPSVAAPYVYTVTDGGKYRLWLKKNGDEARDKALVPAGDAILRDTPIKISDLGPDEDGRVEYLYLEALAGSLTLGDITLKVDLDPDGPGPHASDTASDQVKATAFHIEAVHPIADDFAEGKAGAILISTKQETDKDTAYHTTAITTVAEKKAQSEDAKVTISAYVVPVPPPPSQYPNLTVYFEVTDPDDLSHYEGKTVGTYGNLTPADPAVQGNETPNDNRDPAKRMTWTSGTSVAPAGYPAYQTECLTASSAPVQSPVVFDGLTRAVAETTLMITERYSGDNYQVRATMQDPGGDPFDARSGMTAVSASAPSVTTTVKETETLIAWKRVYIEQDEMITDEDMLTVVGFQPRPDGDFAVVDKGDKVDLYTAGASIDLYSQGGVLPTTVADAGTKAAWLGPGGVIVRPGCPYLNPADLPEGVEGLWQCYYMGIRLSGEDPDCTETDTSLLKEAYGDASDGSDGGAFIEFRQLPEPADVTPSTKRSEAVPNYKAFEENAGYYGSTIPGFMDYWFDELDQADSSVLHLLSAVTDPDNYFRETGLAGVEYDPGMCVVFLKNCSPDVPAGKVVVHEIGHRFGLMPFEEGLPFWMQHVDSAVTSVEKHAHDCNGEDEHCMMSYRASTGEFCVHCLYHLRDRDDQ